MFTYEITVEVSNGDWHWKRCECVDYHDAVATGLDYAYAEHGRLHHIERVEARHLNDQDKARRTEAGYTLTDPATMPD